MLQTAGRLNMTHNIKSQVEFNWKDEI